MASSPRRRIISPASIRNSPERPPTRPDVLLPMLSLLFKTFALSWQQFLDAVTSPRVVASYQLTFGASLIASVVNVVFGLLVAWVLVRYQFPGKKLIDTLVDLPFALPTAVAGISLTALLADNGWIGALLAPFDIHLAGNMPLVSEITPLIIIGKLEQYDYAGATAVALVMLLFSFTLLLLINGLQTWQRRRTGGR